MTERGRLPWVTIICESKGIKCIGYLGYCVMDHYDTYSHKIWASEISDDAIGCTDARMTDEGENPPETPSRNENANINKKVEKD